MTDPIQAAIERAEYAVDLLSTVQPMSMAGRQTGQEILKQEAKAAIRSLAALVREYGHKAGCGCIAPTVKPTTPGYRDPHCLPESHVGRSLDEVIREKYPNGLPEFREVKLRPGPNAWHKPTLDDLKEKP